MTAEIRTTMTASETAKMIAAKLAGIDFVHVDIDDCIDWLHIHVATRGGLLDGSNGLITVYPTQTGSVAKLRSPSFHAWRAIAG